MFENDWRQTPTRPWSEMINQKRATFKQQIRTRQIEQYRSAIRQRFSLLINYSDPASSVAQMKCAIAKQQYKMEYILSLIMDLMTNFNMCQEIADQKLIQFTLIAIQQGVVCQESNREQEDLDGKAEGLERVIRQWVELVFETTHSWPELWRQMYEQSITIYWAILFQYHTNQQICSCIQRLLLFCSNKFEFNFSPYDQDLVFLFRQPMISPFALLSIGQHMTDKSQQNKRSTATS